MKYGIELEFFVQDNRRNTIPAYKATKNLDGNPVIGELKKGWQSFKGKYCPRIDWNSNDKIIREEEIDYLDF